MWITSLPLEGAIVTSYFHSILSYVRNFPHTGNAVSFPRNKLTMLPGKGRETTPPYEKTESTLVLCTLHFCRKNCHYIYVKVWEVYIFINIFKRFVNQYNLFYLFSGRSRALSGGFPNVCHNTPFLKNFSGVGGSGSSWKPPWICHCGSATVVHCEHNM